jgi:antirestriction protein ArdC
LTFNQALEFNAHVRKGEKGSLVVYANRITKTDHDAEGNDVEREISFMKGYTVFSVEQIDGLPEIFYGRPEPKFMAVERIAHAEQFFVLTGAEICYGGNRAYYAQDGDRIQIPPIEAFSDAEPSTPRSPMRRPTGPSTRAASPASSAARPGAMKVMPARNWWPNWQPRSSAPT